MGDMTIHGVGAREGESTPLRETYNTPPTRAEVEGMARVLDRKAFTGALCCSWLAMRAQLDTYQERDESSGARWGHHD